MGDRKLWQVRVEFTYYAQAESATEAQDFADEAWRDGGADWTTVQEVRHSDHLLVGEWSPESVVYGSEGDVELCDLLARLPAKAGRAS